MATTGGANIAVDGLVFGYDTGYPFVSGSSDTYKFNRGEPTVNIRASSGLDGSYSDSGRTIDNSGTLIAPDGSTGWSSISSPGSNSNYRIAKFTYNSLTGGTTYTFTLELYNPGPNSLEIFVDGNNGYPGTTIPLGYSRWSYTITPDTNKTQAIFFGAENKQANATYSPERLIYFKNYLVEQKSHPTPFTTGTRSVSGSLIDLTRTFDINLSNVSFDSNAQMIFDGTDDHARVDTNNILGTFSDWSVDAWIRYETDESTNWMIIVDQAKYSKYYKNIMVWLNNSTNAKKIAMYDGSWQYSNSTIPPDTWTHIAATTEGQVAKMYINGKLDATRTYSWNLTDNVTNFLGIGGTSNNPTYRMNGNIAVVKIYNKTLSDSEVQQNYNVIKERFSL